MISEGIEKGNRKRKSANMFHDALVPFAERRIIIMKSYDEWGRPNQMSLIIGSDVANIDALVDFYLPKPAIDRTTIRMAELLRQRYEQPLSTKMDEEGGTDANDITTF